MREIKRNKVKGLFKSVCELVEHSTTNCAQLTPVASLSPFKFLFGLLRHALHAGSYNNESTNN